MRTPRQILNMKRLCTLALLALLYVSQHHAMIMRNDALISRMVSHFHGKENLSIEPVKERKPDVLTLMQNVLCRNFPSIPCNMITQDDTLKKLIEKSIQQIKYKKLAMEKTTPLPGTHLTLFPVLNGEDLSNFVQMSEIQRFKEKKHNRKQKKSITAKNMRSHEQEQARSKKHKEPMGTTVFNGRKKIRKFYPHKIKYKDKGVKNGKKDFGDYSEERLSMSVEIPDVNTGRKVSYRMEPADTPVWRIDYMKHGEPNINMFGYGNDGSRGTITKTGPNVIVDENVLEQASRKDVLHPDVYIKKNFVRRNFDDANSEGY